MRPVSITVVVVATRSKADVEQCLAALKGSGAEEVVVVACRPELEPITEQAGLTWVRPSGRVAVPHARRLGIVQATSDVVVFTEDTCRPEPGWVPAWRTAFVDTGVVAASGPVEPGPRRRAIDAAVHLFEYAYFLPDLRRPPTRLAGNNVAVLRAWLCLRVGDVVEESDLPTWIARSEKVRAVWVPGACVKHVGRDTAGEAFRDRLTFGWSYGRHRARTFGVFRRWLSLGVGPAIALAQAIHLLRSIVGSPTGRRLTRQAGPFLPALILAWSLGEWAGSAASVFLRSSSPPEHGTMARHVRGQS